MMPPAKPWAATVGRGAGGHGEPAGASADLRLQSAALNAAANAIIITDQDGTIEWVNPAFTVLTGYEAAEVIGRNPRDLVKSGVHPPGFYRALWQTIKAGRVWRGEMTNRRKDGSTYPEEMTITPVPDESGELAHFIAIKQDLTQVKQLQAQYLQSQKMETIGQLASGIAHDFNNLLTVIKGAADLVAAGLPDGDPLREELLQIEQAGDSAASLTRQLLAFSSRQIVRPRLLRLDHLVAAWQPMLQRLIGAHIELAINLPDSMGCARVDQSQIEQVIMNLVVNARDAMPDGGTLTVEMRDVELDDAYSATHPAVEPGPYVLLAVSDIGAGMDAATRVRIFEPFFTTKEPHEGSGLGLATVYGIVTQNGGSIWVFSEPGKGSCFKIYLPRAHGSSEAPALLAAGPLAGGTETVLIVEDHAALLSLAERILKKAGYHTFTARTGAEALRRCEQHSGPVHLLFTDFMLPDANGLELAHSIVSISPDTRVLYTSGYANDDVARLGALGSGTLLLMKPYTARELTHTVRIVLDGNSPTELARHSTPASH